MKPATASATEQAAAPRRGALLPPRPTGLLRIALLLAIARLLRVALWRGRGNVAAGARDGPCATTEDGTAEAAEEARIALRAESSPTGPS